MDGQAESIMEMNDKFLNFLYWCLLWVAGFICETFRYQGWKEKTVFFYLAVNGWAEDPPTSWIEKNSRTKFLALEELNVLHFMIDGH